MTCITGYLIIDQFVTHKSRLLFVNHFICEYAYFSSQWVVVASWFLPSSRVKEYRKEAERERGRKERQGKGVWQTCIIQNVAGIFLCACSCVGHFLCW